MNQHVPSRRATGGFSLIEILVVFAVIALLAALIFPTLQSAKERAWRVACINNERQLISAARLYASDYDGYLPNPSWTSVDNTWRPEWAYDGRPGYGATNVTSGA